MSVRRILTIIGMAIAGLILLIIGFTTWYTVDESEQAVVITFGQANSTVMESGLHFKLPWPIQHVELLSKETYSLKFGYKQDESGDLVEFDKETKMITGDEYIVLTDLLFNGRLQSQKSLLFNSENPQGNINGCNVRFHSICDWKFNDRCSSDQMERQILKRKQEIYLHTN